MRATLTNLQYARLTAWRSGTSELWKESSNCYEADAISPRSSALRFSEFNTENTEIKRSTCPAARPSDLAPVGCCNIATTKMTIGRARNPRHSQRVESL